MSKELFISSSPHETKVAVLEDDQLVEVCYERDVDVGLVGSIYKGRVSRVLPGMQSAFVNIGLERDAFLYVSDFYEDEEEYDKVFSEAEARATRFVEGAPAGPGEAPAEETTVAVATAAETVEPGVSPPCPVAPSVGAAGAPAGAPSVPDKPAGESAESRRHEPRGRRPRRRGREFGERKFAAKPELHERPTERAPHTFEILPGESLAKYRDVASSSAAPEVSPTESAAPETAQELAAAHEPEAPPKPELFVEAAAPLTPTPPSLSTEPAPAETASAPAAAEVAPQLEAPAEQTATPEGQAGATSEPIPALSEGPEEPRPSEVAERGEAAASLGQTAAADAPVEWPELEPPALTPEIGEFAEDFASESADTAPAEPLAQAEESAELIATAPPPAAGTPTEPTEQKYTLREPYQRPRFAPRRRGRRGTGQLAARADKHEPSRPGNHQPVQIADLLKEGQEILVQIAKEPLGTKGARITSHIALPGRYLVYMPTINHIGVSRKITSEEERLRLRNIILENKGSLTGGFIVRTAGGGRSEDEFKADLKFLSTLWSEIRAKAERTKAPALLHHDLDLVQRILRDMLSPDFKMVRVDNEVEYERSLEFVNRCQPSLVGRVKLYTRDTPMFEEFGIQAEVDKALKPKVWLKSGGYIVINQTEALVAIDVNTGKYVGKTNRLEDTIVKTNIDAVNEIVRQIRLRDLGGILVIDFIDMDERRNRMKVVQALEEALRRDRAPTKILSINDFGLVALTRKRVKQSLERTLCQPCTYCSGSGWIKSVASICYEIAGEVKKMAKEIEGDTITLRLNPEVAHALKSSQGTLLSELESLTRKDIIIKSDPTVHQERFEIY
jgi:ribonuclease G